MDTQNDYYHDFYTLIIGVIVKRGENRFTVLIELIR